jgi:hypothetical protein
MSDTQSEKVLSDLFLDKTASVEGREKISQSVGVYIRDRLREVSFGDKVVPPVPVQRSELQRSVNHDTLVKIVDIEPNSRAMSMTFRGQPTARYVEARRYEIAFWTISSEKFEKHEQELMAYEMPVTKIIEENTIKDLQEVKDRTFTIHVDACVQAYQLEGNGGVPVACNAANVNAGLCRETSVVKGEGCLNAGLNNFTIYPVLKPDFIKLRKMLHRRKLRAERVLITEPDFDDVSAWTIQDIGMNMAEKTSTVGWSADGLVGLKYIRTIKTDILREGNVYCFTAPEFFGRNYILNQTKFYIDKIANLITWQSWMDIGFGFGNIAAVVKLELYGGSVTPGATDVGFAAAIPVAEAALGAVNNRAENGSTFPAIDQF